jgi:hypothetical protein
MACPGYMPSFGVGQLDGSAYEGLNCTCWSASRAANDDSCGAHKPSASSVRIWTGDTSGGTNLAQVDDALRVHVGIDLDTRYRYPWSEFVRRVNGGASAILQGWYSPIRDSRFGASETFGGNHAMLVTPRLVAMDPLADGRRTGIYKYHGEAYPATLLRTFAARLNIGSGRYVPLGDGLVYASFTRDNEPDYRLRFLGGAFYVYRLNSDGSIKDRYGKRFSAPTSAPCSAPRLHKWANHTSRSLVQMIGGALDRQYVATAQSQVRLEEI